MRLRLWVKILLVALGIYGLIMFAKWDNEQYEKCMEYTKGNIRLCKDSNR